MPSSAHGAESQENGEQQVVVIPKRIPTRDEVNALEIESIKLFIKKALKDNKAISYNELFDVTVAHAEKARELISDPDERSTQHLPSVVDPLFEDHIKSVGSHLVWLEQIKPKFVMPTG